MAGRRRGLAVAGILAVIVLAGAACGGGGDEDIGGGVEAGPGARDAPGEAAEDTATGEGGGEAQVLDLQLPPVAARIIKNANLSLEVKDGAFDERFQQATLLAARHGGFVASSRTSGRDRRSGTLVLRVPAADFEAVLGELKGLGTITSESISGEDVTAQFVDLEARLRNWEAQEQVLLGLMAKAQTIQESITVQRTLQDVQLAIEEIRGQLRVLDDQTAMSTVTLVISEPGVGTAPPSDGGLPSVSEAWNLALEGFLAVVATVVVSLGYVLPLVLLGGAALYGYRRLRPRPRPAPML